MWCWTTSILLVAVVYGYTTTAEPQGGDDDPIARSLSGVFRGSWMESRRGRWFESYRGIRYAEPPVGELRFKPPVPILEYEQEVDAREDGPACPLLAPPNYFTSEDCLTINVYTPNSNSSKPLPVIFFIHPGGFYSMTGRSDLVGPHYLLDRDLVLVSINYRLGSLGFMSTGDALAPGNNGMKDQVIALKWVQRNIAAFGGDPNLVTIAGVSAGSISVILHMISPMTEGLFHRGIAISASPIGLEPTPSQQYHLAVKQATLLGCPSDNSTVILNCLKTKPWRDFQNYTKFFEFGYDPVLIWQPLVEPDFGQERYLTIDPARAIATGQMRAVPLIVSQTTDEFIWFAYNILKNETLIHRMNTEWHTVAPISFLLPRNNTVAMDGIRQAYFGDRPLKNDNFSRTQLGKLYGDAIIGIQTHRMANLMSQYSPHPVWYYQFAYIGTHSYYEDPVTGKPTAAAHHDDMIYLLSQRYRFPDIPVSDRPDSALVDRMTAIWYNFARFGSPDAREDTPELSTLNWPLMKPAERKYLVIDKEFDVREGLKEDRFRTWNKLYPLWV